jgi:exodeoxyribonuclease VII small subunit
VYCLFIANQAFWIKFSFVLFIMAKNNKANCSDGAIDDLSFEEALAQLEAIVNEMENEDLPLERIIERYEEGARLVRVCQKRLADSELKIQELEKRIGGDFSLKQMSVNNEKTDTEHGE